MNGKALMRLILALTILVSVFLRPPGTMLVVDGDTVAYELCTADGIASVTVALDGDAKETLDLGCEFFAAQIAALPFALPDVAPTEAIVTWLAAPAAPQIHAGQTGWRNYSPRAPPLVS
ncbi:MAG TPA: hypothetical protein DIU07_21030 [Rhodobacteraceae bacterium]|nr:hypothetical protein [Paracoccaceae bacterium]